MPDPPNFRHAGDGKEGFLNRCHNCVHERSFGGGRLACLRCLAWVQVFTVCDDFGSGYERMACSDGDNSDGFSRKEGIGMPDHAEEVTTIVNRRIKKGRELEYANWFGRMSEAIKKAPGFRGVTVLVPGGDTDLRVVLYRFADVGTMEAWENSPERKELMSEINEYATQVYDKAGGLETWFRIVDVRSA